MPVRCDPAFSKANQEFPGGFILMFMHPPFKVGKRSRFADFAHLF